MNNTLHVENSFLLNRYLTLENGYNRFIILANFILKGIFNEKQIGNKTNDFGDEMNDGFSSNLISILLIHFLLDFGYIPRIQEVITLLISL